MKLYCRFCVLVCFTLWLFVMARPALAETPDTDPPAPVGVVDSGPAYLLHAESLLNTSAPPSTPPLQATSVQAISDPDRFGYWWNNSEPFNWYNAAVYGVNTQIIGDDVTSGPFDLGFGFPYYRDTYYAAYISSNGFVAFAPTGPYPSNGTIPSTSSPNGIIAPFWDDLIVNNPGAVYYLRGGSAPNRYFVIEWSNVGRYSDSTTVLTFALVLHENGQIVFQYQSMNGVLSSSTIGIEDPLGRDGLISYLNSDMWGYYGIRFYRPQFVLDKNLEGMLVSPGVPSNLSFSIFNSGASPTDIYDFDLSSTWPGVLIRTEDTTLLTDSDTDGLVDTGEVAQGSTITVTMIITPPTNAVVGSANSAILNIRSSRSSYERQLAVQQAVPAPFAQIYVDNTDGVLRLQVNRPAGQSTGDIASREERGYGITVTALPDGRLLAAWTQARCLDANCNLWVGEIKYRFLDRYGQPTSEIKTLVSHSSATLETYDEFASLAAAPNGVIGVIWRRHLYNTTQGANQNLWFVPLNASGDRTRASINLTNNTAWSNDGGAPFFYDPRIAATGDNRFVLAWVREHFDGATIADIYFAARNTAGDAVSSIVKLTNSIGGSTTYIQPALAAIEGNRAIITYQRRQNSNDAIMYTVVSSSGGAAALAVPDLASNALMIDWNNRDVVQLSNLNILAVWEAFGCYPDEWTARLRYAVLDPNFNLIAGPSCLPRAATAKRGENFVSATADVYGNGILTWEDLDGGEHLYYALLGGSGEIVTSPMILQASQATTSTIWTSERGHGNAPILYPAGAPTSVQLTTLHTSVVADGASQTSVAAIVRDRLGAPVVDTVVQFSTSRGTITQQATTNTDGRAVVQLTSDQTLGAATIQATSAGVNASTSVAFVTGPPTELTATASQSTMVADGVSQADVTATLRDAYGHPLAGVTVNFHATSGAVGSSATTNANGQATVKYTVGASLTTATITAAASGLSATATIQCVAGPPASIEVTTTENTLVADGTRQIQVTALVRDLLVHPVAGVEVNFSATLGAITGKATTNAQGLAIAIFSVGTQPGIVTIGATSGALTDQLTLTLIPDRYNLFLPMLTKARPPAPQLANGNLESGPGVGWQELVNGGSGQLIYARSSRPTLIPAPLSGDYVAWLGGIANQTNTLQQAATLPSEYTMKLRYNYYIASEENSCSNDHVVVQFAGVQVTRFELCRGTTTNNWQTTVVSLDGFKSTSGRVSFTSQLNGSLNSNFFIDNIQLCSDDPAAPGGTLSCAAFN